MRIARRLLFLVFLGAVVLVFLPLQIRAPLGSAPVLGESMEPTLSEGTLVFVRHATSYQPGDIVALLDPDEGKVVLHRVVSVEGARYVTRGDNNEVDDPYQPLAEDIYGRMYWKLPHVGGFAAHARSPFVLGLCGIAIIFVLFVTISKGRKPRLL